MATAPAYLSGFGNEFATEALPGALPVGPEFAAEVPLRALRRAAHRYRVHRAARRQPAQLALPDSSGGGPSTFPAHRQRPPHQRFRRRADAARPAALGSAADAVAADRLRAGSRHDGGQRRPARAVGLRHSRLRRQPLDDTARVLQRRRRDADRAAAGPAALRDRTGRDRRRAAGDRRHPARRALPRRARPTPKPAATSARTSAPRSGCPISA